MSSQSKEWTVTPHRPKLREQISDVWLRRRLITFFLRRAIVDLYAQTILGMAWLFIRPAVIIIAATFVIRDVLGISTSPVPHLLFSLMSFSIWMIFRRGLLYGTKSIIRNTQLMRQFYFPRIILHLAAIGPALVEGCFIFGCALVAMAYFVFVAQTWEIQLGWFSLLIFPSVILLVLLTWGVSMVTSVLNSYARDTQYSIRYFSGILLVVTPVFYPVSVVPESFRIYMWLNPLTPAVEMFRWAVFHAHEPRWEFVALSVVTTLLITSFGLWFFVRWEATALDAR